MRCFESRDVNAFNIKTIKDMYNGVKTYNRTLKGDTLLYCDRVAPWIIP